MNVISLSIREDFRTSQFPEICSKVKSIDKDGEIVEDVDIEGFVQDGIGIVDSLRERFKSAWKDCSANSKFFDEEFNRLMTERLLRQYDVLVMLIDKIEAVVEKFKERIKVFDKAHNPKVTIQMVERVIEQYSKFVSTIRETYLTEGKTNLLIGSVQSSTRLVDRYNWLKDAYEKSQKK